MKRHWKSCIRRGLALTMALVLTAGLSVTALADEATLPDTHDETYYATLDYYGGILNSSVVKSYKTFGRDTITDYGVYDEVTNLTDDLEPTLGDGTVTFQLGANAPSRFYFEGKTSKPLEEFPWTLSLSYTLNGVPTLAEDLAGKEGLVEITLNAVPNPNASEYSRNNLILTAMSTFNGDDILSLEAQGAQVQMVGNLYCVLHMVMPGEEQHFTIRVGSNDFAYSGMIFLAVPATLDQLSQVADLREAKEKAEDSYHAIQDSMDVILDSLDGMSGNLNTTANGLDQLNKARDTISKGKGEVYDSLDIALDAANPMTEAMKPMVGHLATAQQALTDTTQLLNEMSANVTGLKPEVENTRKILNQLQSDMEDLQSLLEDLEDYPDQAKKICKNLSNDFSKLGASLSGLESSTKSLRTELSGLKEQLNGVGGDSEVTISLNGKTFTIPEIKSAVSSAEAAYQQYEQSLSTGTLPEGTSFHVFLTAVGGKTEEEATEIETLLSYSKTEEFKTKIESGEQLNALLKEFNMSVSQMRTLVNKVSDKGTPVLKQLENLCSALGTANLSGDLQNLSSMMEDLMKDIDDHNGTLSSSASTVKNAAALGVRVSANADKALDQIQSLTDIMNTYEPQAQQALEDAKTFTDSAATSITALVDTTRSAEKLLKNSGGDFDEGTRQALAGLAAALRKSTRGLSQTGTIRNAKDTIDALITDEWDSHTGEDNNILLMDAAAKPISLTDERNEGTISIQYVMRSQEIKVEEPDEVAQEAAAQADKGTVWTRIGDMFKDLWHTVTGWFH